MKIKSAIDIIVPQNYTDWFQQEFQLRSALTPSIQYKYVVAPQTVFILDYIKINAYIAVEVVPPATMALTTIEFQMEQSVKPAQPWINTYSKNMSEKFDFDMAFGPGSRFAVSLSGPFSGVAPEVYSIFIKGKWFIGPNWSEGIDATKTPLPTFATLETSIP